MASDDSARRRERQNTSAIPLQDLTHGRTPERSTGGSGSRGTHQRTLSDRGRDLLERARSSGSRGNAYARLEHGSPSPPQRNTPFTPIAFVTTPSGQHERIPDEDDEAAPLSPVADPGAYQSAIGFAGLSFRAESSPEDTDDEGLQETPPRQVMPDRTSRATLESLPPLRTLNSSDDLVPIALDDGGSYLSPSGIDDDREPLTNSSPSSRLQPSSAATSIGQRHDRHSRPGSALSGLSMRLPGRGRSPSDSRLGDDLRSSDQAVTSATDLGRSPSNRHRTLSVVESPLHRTSTMLRKMSQRVVNLSNESEMVERELHRKTSNKEHRTEHTSRAEQGSRTPTQEVVELGLDGFTSPGQESRSPVSEKATSPVVEAAFPNELPAIDRNPLRGKSLGLLSPDNKVRRWLLNFLVHPFVEPAILVLIIIQTVILAVDASPNVNLFPRPEFWVKSWADYVLLGIFVVYTFEIIVKVLVSGFIFNPVEYSTIDRSIGVRNALLKKANALFALHRSSSKRGQRGAQQVQAPESLLRSFTYQDLEEVPGGSRQAQKKRLAYRAFLRHSFNRLDFVAVVSFWISFVLSISGMEAHHSIYVFRMMSCLRILRLLGITSGTSIILRSLKRAAPTLLNVAFLIGFFWLLFAVVGVQSFKSSLRRQCVWQPGPNNYTQNSPPPGGSFQFCGGWLAANGSAMPWLKTIGEDEANPINGTSLHKGYLCPVESYCIEGENPFNNTVSFDNILQSLEMVFVIMTSNTFTDIMYYLTDTDYLAAALFFAFGIIILTFWLVSLLIAVITSSFQIIREESRTSAFMAHEDPAEDIDEHSNEAESAAQPSRITGLKWLYEKTYWLWITAIVFDLIIQSLRTDTMGSIRTNLISHVELGVTVVLLFEIFFRFASDWRDFAHHRRNWFDLTLAIITGIMQLPPIRNSGTPYDWLTFFQILRIYRVVLAVEITRELILLVLRHVSGIVNLIMFVFLLTFLASIFAAQLFRGQLPNIDSAGNYVQVPFTTIFNSFLGMYQILSSENWTSILYNVQRFTVANNTAWIGATFIIIWYILANFIVLNMFIAVIQENFDVSEDQKRLQQVRAFLTQKELGGSGSGTLSLSTIFKFGQVRRQDPLDFGPAATEMLLKDAVVRDFMDEQMEMDDTAKRVSTRLSSFGLPKRSTMPWYFHLVDRLKNSLLHHEPNPFYSRLQLTKPFEELDPRTLAQEVVQAAEQRKVSQRNYLRRYPRYNVSLFIFTVNNPIRKFCQRIVGPGRGTRIQGVSPNAKVWYTFSAFIYLAIVGMVLLACVTTPLFQHEYFIAHANSPTITERRNWFIFSDIGFATLFTIEAIIKVIADGFFWTPNAYFHSSWGFIDGVVLITLWANVFTALTDPGSGSRAVGAFKALRALRLLNVSDSARDTFHSVIILGGWKVLSAAFVSLSLLIPFAIYGLNLFAGKMDWCNDWQQYDIVNLTDCVGESTFSPNGWNIIGPRRVAPFNTNYDFDSFGDALFILFQIVSQEGWVDVMWSAQSITGVFTQPSWFAQQGNAVYFVMFNLLGAVFVLTLFVSVFMRNYTEQTGVAFLTSDQRSWLELRKLLRQVAPSKRPNRQKQRMGWQEWCYRRAVTKTGRWQRTVTGILIVHLILLCTEYYPEPAWWTATRMVLFFVFLWAYIGNIVIRVIGLSWTRFRKSAWDVYSLVAVTGTLVTAVMNFITTNNGLFAQVHKLFLVSLALLLIPRNNQLDQLFKTAAASFSAIANLLATWFVLFLVYAIAFTQAFGLTRFGPNETDNINFRTVPKALILLFRMSVGEGWNQIMIDYANVVPPYCTAERKYYDGDCGSAQWAYALFVSWNIISMYIFVNLFISLIYESFSYVYQRSTGLSVISREEIRRFKQAWAEFDPDGTGYISKEIFPRFLGELSGIFEMRIYDGDFTVSALIQDCMKRPKHSSSLPLEADTVRGEIDLDKLNRRLAELPVDEIRARRARMNRFYEEVLVSADPDRGIAFNALLMILAHYKVINDSKSLRLEEFLRRRARLQRVEEAVLRNTVKGSFDAWFWSRRFRQRREAKVDARMTAIPTFGVPEIFVQDEASGGASSNIAPTIRKINVPAVSVTSADPEEPETQESLRVGRAPTSSAEASGVRRRSGSIQRTPSASPTRGSVASGSHLAAQHKASASGSSIQPDWHVAAALERVSPPPSPGLSATGGSGTESPLAARSRANSAVSQSEMVGMFQDSAWGQSMRRSFTMKRGGSTSQRPPSS